jgi:hypothetical protein
VQVRFHKSGVCYVKTILCDIVLNLRWQMQKIGILGSDPSDASKQWAQQSLPNPSSTD